MVKTSYFFSRYESSHISWHGIQTSCVIITLAPAEPGSPLRPSRPV